MRWKINIQKDWGEVGFGTLFSWKDIIVLDSDQVFCLVPAVLHLSAAKSEHSDFNILKKLQMFVRIIENFALELIKNV